MKEIQPKPIEVTHEDEPLVQYKPGYEVLTFPFYNFEIKMKCADEWNSTHNPEVYIKIYNEDGRDVTLDYYTMEDGPGYIRPTLYNLKDVLDLLTENIEALEEEEEEEAKDAVDTKG
jgi:hypothetical protein